MTLQVLVRSKNEFGITDNAELRLQYMCAPHLKINYVMRPAREDLNKLINEDDIKHYIDVEIESDICSGRRMDLLVSKVGILASEGDGTFKYSNHYLTCSS